MVETPITPSTLNAAVISASMESRIVAGRSADRARKLDRRTVMPWAAAGTGRSQNHAPAAGTSRSNPAAAIATGRRGEKMVRRLAACPARDGPSVAASKALPLAESKR
jgi:hypothetical protein